MDVSRMVRVLTVAAACGLAAPLAAQDVVWIGRPTIGDHLRHHLGQLIQAQQQAVRSKAQFGAELAAAREAFFATAQRPQERAAVEKRFSELLFGKDLLYLSGFIAEGTGTEARKRNQALHLLTGGEIDGGIAPPARRAFDAWVDGVRTSLGARNPNELLLVLDSSKLLAAIEANTDRYVAYKALRDRFEIDRFTTAKAARDSRVGPGSWRLHEASHGPLDVAADMRMDLLGQTRPLRTRLSELARGGQAVLRCAYGPKSGYADGTPQYEHVLFWHRQAPADIDELLAADTARGMARLRTRVAREQCPEHSGLAKAIFEGGEAAGRAHAAKTPKQLEDEQRAAVEAMAEQQRATRAAERDVQAQRQREQYAAQERAQQAQRAEMEARKQAQIDANAERLQTRRDASLQRQCAGSQAQIERMRTQIQSLPPANAVRYQQRLEAMTSAHARRCGE